MIGGSAGTDQINGMTIPYRGGEYGIGNRKDSSTSKHML